LKALRENDFDKRMKKEFRELMTEMRSLIAEGLTPRAIMNEMKIDHDTYKKVYRRVLASEIEVIESQNLARTYALYLLKQEQIIKELDKMIDDLDEASVKVLRDKDGTIERDDDGKPIKVKTGQNAVARVGAKRLKSDIIDKIWTKGEQCGMIGGNKADQDEIDLGKKTDKQLKDFVRKEVFKLSSLDGYLDDPLNTIKRVNALKGKEKQFLPDKDIKFRGSNVQVKVKPRKYKKLKKT